MLTAGGSETSLSYRTSRSTPIRSCGRGADAAGGAAATCSSRTRAGWRPDRDPRSCTYEQLEEPVSFDLAEILAGDTP